MPDFCGYFEHVIPHSVEITAVMFCYIVLKNRCLVKGTFFLHSYGKFKTMETAQETKQRESQAQN